MKLDYMIELEGGFRIHGSEELRSGCLRIRPVLPEGRVKAVTARVNITMAEDERFFVNGYQTWTYCPEQGRHGFTRGLGEAAEIRHRQIRHRPLRRLFLR